MATLSFPMKVFESPFTDIEKIPFNSADKKIATGRNLTPIYTLRLLDAATTTTTTSGMPLFYWS
jgi:hypothetical protein